MQTFSILITHGRERNCLTGICNLTLPILPETACNGNPKLRRASGRRGKFSNSTSPKTITNNN